MSIVIPVYNERDRLGRTLEALQAYARASARRCEVIIVDDGSTDGTTAGLRDGPAGALGLRVLVQPANRGKGAAVRAGVLAARGRAILFADADLSTPIQEVERLLPLLDAGADIVIGSRDQPDSVLCPRQPWPRWFMGHVFREVRRRLVLPDLLDTQCGFKLFRAEAAREVFRRQTIERFAFDVEVLAIARRLGYRIREVGVRWSNDRQSRVRMLRDPLRMLLDLWCIRRRWGGDGPRP